MSLNDDDLNKLNTYISDHTQGLIKDLHNIAQILDEAKETSLFRLEETLSRIDENIEQLGVLFKSGNFHLDYRICDIELPEIEVRPDENSIAQKINKFLTSLIEFKKIKFNEKVKEFDKNDKNKVEKEIMNEENEVIMSPKAKKIKDEGIFVASMKRLWESKTPKLTSIRRKYDVRKSLNVNKFHVIKMDTISIIDVDEKQLEDLSKLKENSLSKDSSISVNKNVVEDKKESFKSINNDDVISPRPTNVLSIELSPLQSPPLLALTPSTPIPIIKTQTNNNSSSKVNSDVNSNVNKMEELNINKENVSRNDELLRSMQIDNKENCNKNFQKSLSNNNEDSPLPPRPIRRLTNEQTDKNLDKGFVEDYKGELSLLNGDQTPILANNLERTPKETSVEITDTGFVRPERISYIKKSGLRSILNHSANRFLLDHNNFQSQQNNDPNSNRTSLSSHLVKTPINNKGFSKLEIEGKDKQKIGESPCRRYHKRLKLLPPINPDDSYVLTDSEDEKNANDPKISKVQKKIPLWARSVNWIPKMKEQRNVDPFSIFGDSCMFMDLEDVFQRPWYISTAARDHRIKSWQNDRLTSLNWSDDSLTSEELREYKLRMNFYIDKSNEVYVTEPCFTPSPNPITNGAWNHINKQRINSGGTTVIRKALNLSIHRFNSNLNSANKVITNSNKNPENCENSNTKNIDNLQQKNSSLKMIVKEHSQNTSHNSSFLQ